MTHKLSVLLILTKGQQEGEETVSIQVGTVLETSFYQNCPRVQFS